MEIDVEIYFSNAQMCFYMARGWRPPHIAGCFVNTVAGGWVGALNERAPLRVHRAVVGFVDRCLLRTQNLAVSNLHWAEFSSWRSWPDICPGMDFFRFFFPFILQYLRS